MKMLNFFQADSLRIQTACYDGLIHDLNPLSSLVAVIQVEVTKHS